MNFERYVQSKAGSNDIESSSRTDTVTKPPDIREILPVAWRVLHSFLILFWAYSRPLYCNTGTERRPHHCL